MDGSSAQDAPVQGIVPFDRLEKHYQNHVVFPSIAVAIVILALYAATLAWFLSRDGYADRQALVFLYGFVFLLGFVAIWSIVHTMLAALGEAQSRLLNTLGAPVPEPPTELLTSIRSQTAQQIAALNNDQVQNIATLATISTGANRAATQRGIGPVGSGPTIILRGLYDAAKNLPDARFLLIAFVFLLLIALSIDPNYELPSLTVDISSQEAAVAATPAAPTPLPSEAPLPTVPAADTTTLPLVTEPPNG